MDKRHLQEKIPEIHLVFFIQCDVDSHDGIKNRKLFRNYLSRFSIECTRIDVQIGRPVVLDLNYDENKIKTKIHEHLKQLSTNDTHKLERLHIFYFGRYWRKLDNILDLPLLDSFADKVHLTSMEMRKYGEILESDMLNFYSGNEHHSISLNDSIDEFYELAIQTDQKHVPLQNIKMDFIKFGSFLAMRNLKSNEAINIINEIACSHISSVDLGFIMGNRKIDISEEALDELESQTGLSLNRETKYILYDCYMKTSVARYQKLRNGAPSKFYSRSVRSQDSGIAEDHTEDDTYNKYQNPDFERQEKYAIMENIIKNSAIYETNYKTYFVADILNDLSANNKIMKHDQPNITTNELSNGIMEISDENDNIFITENSEYNLYSSYYGCQTLPMDKFGSLIGSYYHGHPYIGSISNDGFNNEQTIVCREVGRHPNGDSNTSDSKKQERFTEPGKSLHNVNFNRGVRKRSHGDDDISENETNSRFKRAKQLWDKDPQLYADPYDSDISYANAYEEDSYYEFDLYETASPISPTRLMKWSAAVDKFFKRTWFLRNIRTFWLQILCTIVFILGKDFEYINNCCQKIYRYNLYDFII